MKAHVTASDTPSANVFVGQVRFAASHGGLRGVLANDTSKKPWHSLEVMLSAERCL